MDETQIERLELRLAYQEEAIQVLSDRVIEQQTHIDRVERLCDALRDRLTEVAQAVEQPDGAAEKPPHY